LSSECSSWPLIGCALKACFVFEADNAVLHWSRYDCHWAWSAPSLHVDGSTAAVDGTTWGQAVLQDVTARFMSSGLNGTAMRPGQPSGDDVTPFQMGCAESNHPTSHRYSVHWTGDIFSEDLIGSVADTIRGGIEGFKPYVHPDCTAHHNYDEPEVYIRWIQFCSLSNVFRVHSDPYNDRRPWYVLCVGIVIVMRVPE
jgi:hypothetical protein